MDDLRSHFSHFLGAEPRRLHVAAHGHHPWPDVTRTAQLEAWDPAARRMDHEWEEVPGPVRAEAQGHIAPDPSSLVFAVNTHEFLRRILSALPERPRILTTSGQFHFFDLPDAEAWSARLDAARIVTGRRGNRLRCGFGLYHTAAEVDALLDRLSSTAQGSATGR